MSRRRTDDDDRRRGLHPLWGHEGARSALARARLRESLPAGLLLHGPRGVGKQRLALWVGQLLLCSQAGEAGPCGACHSCRLAVRLEHPDLHWHMPLPRPTGASTPEKRAEALEEARWAELAEIREDSLRPSVTDDVRAHYLAAARALRTRARNRPAMSERQVFVLGDAETLVPQESSPEAANALLKLLEEPPESTHFILTSSEPGRLLSTIRSRTLPLHLGVLPRTEVERFLVEEAGADPAEARRAAGLAHGSVGRALGFLPDEEGEPGPLEALRQEAARILAAGLSPRPGAGFRLAVSYGVSGARGMVDLLGFVDEWIRDLAAAAAGAPERIVNADARGTLEGWVRKVEVDPVEAAAALESVEEARAQARGNVNPQLIVTGLVAGLRRRLTGAGSGAAGGGRW